MTPNKVVPAGTLQSLPTRKQLEINIIMYSDAVNVVITHYTDNGIDAVTKMQQGEVREVATNSFSSETALETPPKGAESSECQRYTDNRPPMDPKYSNRHAEYVASRKWPKDWYGVL